MNGTISLTAIAVGSAPATVCIAAEMSRQMVVLSVYVFPRGSAQASAGEASSAIVAMIVLREWEKPDSAKRYLVYS